jgi:hypothetical protein
MADFSHLSRTAVSATDATAVLAAFTPQAPTGSTAAAIPSWADGMGGMACWGTYRAGVCTMRCKRHSAATRTSVPHTLVLSTPMRPTVTLNILIPQHLAPTTMLGFDTLSTHHHACRCCSRLTCSSVSVCVSTAVHCKRSSVQICRFVMRPLNQVKAKRLMCAQASYCWAARVSLSGV